MKKFISVLLSFIITFSMLSSICIFVFASDESALTFSIEDNEACVTKCDTSSAGAIVIPDSFSGVPVTKIGASAFKNCTKLTSITIPLGVKTIGKFAFEGCTAVTSIVVPDSVTFIGDAAFLRCTKLLAINIPSGLTSISPRTYSDCAKLKTIKIPDCVKTIGYNAFYGCKTLKDIVIPEGVTYVDSYAFACCTALKTVSIPNTVSFLGNDAFATCTALDEVTIPNNAVVASEFVFSGCTALEKINFLDDVTEIGNFVFYNCKKLTNVNFTENIVSIGDAAFFGSVALTSVELPKTIENIGVDAFGNCVNITDVYYVGSNLDWKNIDIKEGNEYLIYADIHFAYHEHDYVSLSAQSSPLCCEDTYTVYSCECGDFYTVTTPAAGHSCVTVVEASEPTCTEDGCTAKVVCEVCGEVIQESEIIPATGHNFVETITPGLFVCECGATEEREIIGGDEDGNIDLGGLVYSVMTINDSDDGDSEVIENNTDVACSCGCHKSGIYKFLWNILNIFRKLFGGKNYKCCDCHTESR